MDNIEFTTINVGENIPEDNNFSQQISDINTRLDSLARGFSSDISNRPYKTFQNSLTSPNYKSGSSGWIIKENGDVEFNDGTFRGALSASTIDIGGSDATSFHVDIDGNMWLGAATFATSPFRISNVGLLEAGDLSGDPDVQYIEIDGAAGTFTSYLDGVARTVIGAGAVGFKAPLGGNGGSIASLGGSQISLILGDGTVNAIDFIDNGDTTANFVPQDTNKITLGTSSLKWSDVRSTLINGADIGFANGWKFREWPATKEDIGKSDEWMKENANLGIQLLNNEEELIAIIHKDGYIYCNGIKNLNELI